MANRMGADRAYISALELGSRNPTATTLWHVAQALNVKVHQLLKEETDEPMSAPPVKRKRASKRPK